MHIRIPLISPKEFEGNQEIVRWFSDNCIPTHYEDSVIWVLNDGNPFWEWLLREGDVKSCERSAIVAIEGT